jgi:CBS domain-containing protein
MSRMHTAGDAMQAPAWVKRGERVKDAFKRMHENRLPGLPMVDERYRVVGYINLLGLLAMCLQRGDKSPCAEEAP